jgi:Fur family ferric uptake transcriptional regulator
MLLPMTTDLLAKILKENGYSLTLPRQIVFKVIANNTPLFTSELISHSSDQIDRASVYRTIELFTRLGIINRVNVGWKHKLELSEKFIGHHHHLQCTSCGKVIDMPENAELESKLTKIARSQNFLIRSHQVEIFGICPECSEK